MKGGGTISATVRVLLWILLLAGAALSLYLSYGLATHTLMVGSRDGRWVYGYMQPLSIRIGIVYVVALALMLFLLRASNRPGWAGELGVVAVWFAAALVIQALVCWLAPFGFEKIFLSDGANSFNSVASRFTPATMLGDFERARTFWPPHGQSNMPGKAILVYWLRQLSKDPLVLAWLVVVVSNIGGLFLYGIARDLFDRETALYAFVLYLVTPGKMFFFPLLNTATPLVVFLATWLFVRWQRTRNPIYAVLLGPAIYAIVLFEPLGLAVGGLLLFLMAWGFSRGMMRGRSFVWQGTLAVAAFGATYAWMYSRFRFDLLAIVRLLAADAQRFNVEALRPYDVWVRQNLFDFVIAAGACQAVLLMAAIVSGLGSGGSIRDRLSKPAVLVSLGLAFTLGATDLIGINRGEVVRLWIFLACAWQLPAAYVAAQLNHRLAFALVLAVTLLHDVLGTAMIGFILPG